MPCYNYYHGAVAEPRLVGGDTLDLRDFELEEKHLTQDDKSLNEKLWSYHPVDRPINPGPTPVPEVFDIPGPPYNLESVVKYAKHDEFRRIDLRGEILLSLYGQLAEFRALPYFLRLMRRKEDRQVAPLKDAVREVTAKKVEINSRGEYTAAFLGYFECLSDLLPWSACPLYLTSRQCYDSGLAELEASLWNNACISAAKSAALNETDTHVYTSICGAHVFEMRYAPIKHVYKAHLREIEFLKERRHSGYPVPPGLGEPWRLHVLQEFVPETKDKTSSEWMHRHCITEHVCYSDRMLTKLRASGARAASGDVPALPA